MRIYPNYAHHESIGILTCIVCIKTAGVNCLHIAIVKVDDSLQLYMYCRTTVAVQLYCCTTVAIWDCCFGKTSRIVYAASLIDPQYGKIYTSGNNIKWPAHIILQRTDTKCQDSGVIYYDQGAYAVLIIIFIFHTSRRMYFRIVLLYCATKDHSSTAFCTKLSRSTH